MRLSTMTGKAQRSPAQSQDFREPTVGLKRVDREAAVRSSTSR